MTHLWVEDSEKQHDLPKLCRIPKIHKSPYKSRFIAGSKYLPQNESLVYSLDVSNVLKPRKKNTALLSLTTQVLTEYGS